MPLIFLFACLPPTYRDSWEVLALLENGQLFEARFTKGDTGILKGQGHLRVNRWIHRATPMSFHLDTPPEISILNDSEADFFTHQLYRQDDVWKLQMRADEFNASVYFRPHQVQPIVEEATDWSVKISPQMDAVGWTTADKRSALLEGHAAIFRRNGSQLLQSERYLFLGFDSQNYWGAEWSNQIAFSWGNIDQIDYRSSNIEVENNGTFLSIQLPNHNVHFYPEKRFGSDNQYKHLSWGEKTLSQSFLSTDDRTLLQGYFIFHPETQKRMLPGILIYHGTTPPSIHRKQPSK